MARADAERNLLFGVLALQLDFISREDLIAAVSAWSMDKSRSLDAILVNQGALAQTRRDLLEPLVREHLKSHGDDPAESLAAVGIPGTVRNELKAVADSEIEASLNGSASRFDGATPTLTFAVPPHDPVGSRFRVLRPLARGGIGMISVALDTDLNREVALKQIRPENKEDHASRVRFTLEAEVTGRLEHPGVVPVYGLGCGLDGEPYYAMRLIKGESLKEAIERLHGQADVSRGSLALRGLLNRFVAVCYAVAYAHSRGVIHRDLKPANIMLGPYGETLVVDWGLAKVVGREEAGLVSSAEGTLRPGSGSSLSETVAGAAIGTPAYMSPEQAEGRLDAIGPASDVYSLGATLYALLAGRPSLDDRDVGTILRRVARGDFPPPRSFNPAAPRALEAVCLKAMALLPSDRYATARALAEEIEHWLADEPVKAFREPSLTRLARWGRRHKTGVAAAVALLLTAVVGLAAGTLVLGQANARTERERDLAQYHFRTARKAVDDYLTRVGKNPLLKERGLHDLRRELLEAALVYYQDFLRQQANDPGVRVEAASAYEAVGDIHKELGRFADALLSYDQGLSLADQPGQSAIRLRMEASRIPCFLSLGRFDDGISALERAAKPYIAGRALGSEEQASLLKLYNEGAELYSKAGKGEDAVKIARKALKVGEEYTRDRPDDREALLDLIFAYTFITRFLFLSGQTLEAAEIGRHGLDLGASYIRAHPGDIDIRLAYGSMLFEFSWIEQVRNHPEESLKQVQLGVDLLEGVCRENPLLFRHRLMLADMLSTQSNQEAIAGQFPEARRSAEHAVELAREILARSPGLPRVKQSLGASLLAVGRAMIRTDERTQALANLKQARDLLAQSSEPAFLYNASCAAALASSFDDPTEGGSAAARRAHDAEDAVALLKSAVDHGMSIPDWIKNDPDLKPLHGREDLEAIVRMLESQKTIQSRSR